MLRSIKHLFTLAACVFGTLSTAPPTQALFPMGDSTYKDLITYGEGFEGVIGYLPSPADYLFSASPICSAAKIGETLYFGEKKDLYLTAAHCVYPPFAEENGGRLDPRYLIALHPTYAPKYEDISSSPTEQICTGSQRADLALFFAPGTNKPMHPLYQGEYKELEGYIATTVGYGQRYKIGSSISPLAEPNRPRQAADIKISYDNIMNILYHTFEPWASTSKVYATITSADSGGPLLVRDPQGKLVVIGVTSLSSWIEESIAFDKEETREEAFFSSYFQPTQATKPNTCDSPNEELRKIMTSFSSFNYYKAKHYILYDYCLQRMDTCFLDDIPEVCYGGTDKWEPIDMDFIRPILEQFNVTTP